VSPDIRLERWFDARPEVVFDAYTDPDAQRDLRAGGPDWIVETECDLRVGGNWIIRFGPPSTVSVERNVFHVVDRPHRLVYASTTEWPDGTRIESLIEIGLQWLDGRTLLTFTLRGVPPGDLERRFAEGWKEFLDGFVARIRTRPASERAETEEPMSKVTADITMSLDGFITDPKASVGTPLEGNDPGRLHDWMFDAKTDADTAIADERYASTGAVLIGRRMFDAGFEPWGDPPPFGMPVFVLTHETRDAIPMQGGTTYFFVTDVEGGLEQARAAAGEKNVSIWGGGNIIREYLRARLVDELEIHVAPVLLGGGIRLFQELGTEIELRTTRCIQTPGATHLRFELVK
jgi:dihydrofolate reductase/uncharacterized protein YndB with AHSA1/START domain